MAYATILIVAGACTFGEILADHGDPVDMRPADLIGTWHSGRDRSIAFDEGGTFTALDLPFEVFDGLVPEDFDPVRQRLDGSGTWRLEPSDTKPDGPKTIVALHFQRLAGTEGSSGMDLTALQRNNVVRLFFFYVGSGGNSWCAYAK